MNKRLQIGEMVGDYRIVSFLGAGGMGAVYQGVHTKINRPAAIKVLAFSGKDSTIARRFFNEARLQAGLHHPNIATLYDFQEIGERLFIVMEYVDGETLEALIKRRYFAVEDALKTFETICEAVAFIHGNSIIHRDIKPQNIKLSSRGVVKLLDFGIAKDSISQGLTRIGGVIGTPNYLAPEQLVGKPATPRSDIWALGVLFYEMLTGDEPFKGNTFGELHMQITTGKFEEPEKINPAVTPDVSRIVSKCLEKNPEGRYQSVKELITDVRRALSKYYSESFNNIKKPSVHEPKPKRPAKNDSPKPDLNDGSENQITPEEKKLSLTGIIAGAAAAIVLLFGVVGFGIWAMSDSQTGNQNTGSRQNDSSATSFQSVNSAPAKDNKTISSQSGQNTNLPRVRVEVIEGAAQVYRNGQFIGVTPVDLEGRENESVDLTFKREGYEDKNVQIEIATRRKVYTFSLRRKQ